MINLLQLQWILNVFESSQYFKRTNKDHHLLEYT